MTFLNCDSVHGPVEEECKVIIIQIKIMILVNNFNLGL